MKFPAVLKSEAFQSMVLNGTFPISLLRLSLEVVLSGLREKDRQP